MGRAHSQPGIEAVLFNADGVVQSASPERRNRLAALLPPEDTGVTGFMAKRSSR
jgi:hypothetical protein